MKTRTLGYIMIVSNVAVANLDIVVICALGHCMACYEVIGGKLQQIVYLVCIHKRMISMVLIITVEAGDEFVNTSS